MKASDVIRGREPGKAKSNQGKVGSDIYSNLIFLVFSFKSPFGRWDGGPARRNFFIGFVV
jgi:hypothetical protein